MYGITVTCVATHCDGNSFPSSSKQTAVGSFRTPGNNGVAATKNAFTAYPSHPPFFPTCGNDSSTVCSITLSAKSPPFSNRTATPRYVCNDRFVTSTRNFFVCRSFISPSLSNRISICGFG